MAKRRILIVDDSVDTLELLRATLEGEFETYELEDSVKFFDVLRVLEPDLVILDLMMPNLNGFQILEQARSGSRGTRVPFIVLSAKRAVADQKMAYSLGAKLYLPKPFEPDRLLRNVRMTIDGLGLRDRPKQYPINEIDHILKLQKTFGASLKPKPEVDEAPAAASRKSGGRSKIVDSPKPVPESEDDSKETNWVN